jgi:hypothetical protein
LALLNNPEATARILDLYRQIGDVYEGERQRLRSMCCDLCGAQHCVRDVLGFAVDPPKLCIRHGAAWNAVWVRHSNGLDVYACFAKWLAGVVLKAAEKAKDAER